MQKNEKDLGATPQRSPEAGSIAPDAAPHVAHTPGPWKVYEIKHPFEITRSDGSPYRGEHIERRIGTAWDHPQLQGPYGVVNISYGVGERGSAGLSMVSIDEANAHLIAAAPELYEALRTCVWAEHSNATHWPAGSTRYGHTGAFESCPHAKCRLIAKAEGRE